MTDEIIICTVFFVIGLILTIRGGDLFVDGAVQIAAASGIPRFVIGATIVSFCTTAPELTVSLIASLRGQTELAVGNAIGSVSCNTGLILGVSSLLMPSLLSEKEAKTKGTLMIITGVLLGCFSVDGVINSGEALGLFALLFTFFAMNLSGAAKENGQVICAGKLKTIIWFFIGAGCVILGAKLMVDHGVRLAYLLGVPSGIIGLTLVALGTSLPELMTTLAAIRKKQGALSVGNIIGANIINLTLVVPACAAVGGGILQVADEVFTRDLPFAVVLMLIGVIPPMLKGKLFRRQGAMLILVYAAYIYVLMCR